MSYWNTTYSAGALQHDGLISAQNPNLEDPRTLLSMVFFAAISIYLSGIFDYEMHHWRHYTLAPATLDCVTVQMHVTTILDGTRLALDSTNTSPISYLFPLRIAGARSQCRDRRDCVMMLLGRIKGTGFVVAASVEDDLERLYEQSHISESKQNYS